MYSTSYFREYIHQIWVVCCIFNLLWGNLQGLTRETLNVCGDLNYQITCPENTVLIILGVTKLDGTICKDEQDCPGEEGLKSMLIGDCFAKSVCDMNETTICGYHEGGLAVEAACAKETNVLINCVGQEKQLSRNSGPIVITTPGYPEEYNVPVQCSNIITVNSDIQSGQISVVDRQSQGLNAYLCGSTETVEVHIQPGLRDNCLRVSSTENYPNVASITFTFHSSINPVRGILFEITSDNVIEDDSIVPILVEKQPVDNLVNNSSTTTTEENSSFFTPLVVVGVTAGAAVVFLLLILIIAVSCKCGCRNSSQKQKNKKKPTKKSGADTSQGAEAFFAGAKVENPYSDKKDVPKQSREPPKVKDIPKENGDTHIYQNTAPVNSVTVVAEVHRERTRPRSKRKPMKLPRKSKPPSANLQPIYENEGSEPNSPSTSHNGTTAYENVGYNNTA